MEWPVVLMGRIDQQFMTVPPEVLTTSMRTHQKYFALQDKTGKLAARFLVVANMDTPDKGAQIIAGNERVLRARLQRRHVLLGAGPEGEAGRAACRRSTTSSSTPSSGPSARR